MADPRWRRILAVTPYIVLGMLVVFVLVARGGSWPVAVPTLALVARSWSARTGVPSTVTASGPTRPLSTEVEVALLRTAQEALANVERHAQAARVTLTLRMDAAHIRLDVRDDGRGFDAVDRLRRSPDAAGGYGLIAMRERLAQAAGDLVVESRPGHGTLVRAEVPA